MGLLSYLIKRELSKRSLNFSLNNTETATTRPAVHRTRVSPQHFSVIQGSTEKSCTCVQASNPQDYCCCRKSKGQAQLAAFYEIRVTSICRAATMAWQQPLQVCAPVYTGEFQLNSHENVPCPMWGLHETGPGQHTSGCSLPNHNSQKLKPSFYCHKHCLMLLVLMTSRF